MTKRCDFIETGHQITIVDYNILLGKSTVNLEVVAYHGGKRGQDT
ncbi:hypothetical protein GCM10010969_17120 [Saccharibacillus kuerlensis]|uniref:Uncharacterized protein n=1 Tax=Saccharibacillus kuerlensis TaxID=459527 RepID=A0ABQ2L0P3_9BACL|nr:hypothetical protein GCM10010969_17120 [Saccharibacillus kuerlensis]